jgi:PhnB protein
MKQIVPEIYIKNCAKALDFYQELFGGKVKNIQMSDNLPAFRDQKGKVVHAELHVNSRCVFYFADIFDEKRKNVGNMTLMLHMDSEDEILRVYDMLSKNGTVGMPLQKTYWDAQHAIVTDKYGAPWALNYAPKN